MTTLFPLRAMSMSRSLPLISATLAMLVLLLPTAAAHADAILPTAADVIPDLDDVDLITGPVRPDLTPLEAEAIEQALTSQAESQSESPIHPPLSEAAPATVSESCLANMLCSLKDELRWRRPPWTAARCTTVARGILEASERHNLSPALLLAVMINESDLDEKTTTPYYHGSALYAKDSGLMGIRCVFDRRGRCKNGLVRGVAFRSVMDPVRNIELGARELEMDRDGDGGAERVTVRKRTADGRIVTKTKIIHCRHTNHAYWAHYNHGQYYISRGYARHYPHRVAVLYYALAHKLGLPTTELETMAITMRDPGRRPRTIDRPVEPRYRTLCDKIDAVAGSCQPSMTAFDGGARPRITR